MNSTDINSSEKRATCFGPFRYDWEQRLLFREGETVPLAPKVAETLRVLLERHGTVVEKAELMREVWPDTTVEEIGLARNISQLRKALGDESESGRVHRDASQAGIPVCGRRGDGGGGGRRAGGSEGRRAVGAAGSLDFTGGGGVVRDSLRGVLAVLPAVALSLVE